MKLGHLSGTGYRSKAALGGIHYDQREKDLVIGRGDTSPSEASAVLLGKVCERSSATDHFDANVWLDVTFPHVVFVCGRRGSGKSYDLGVIAEGLSRDGPTNFSRLDGTYCTILFDLQSQFWTLGSELNSSHPDDAAQMALVNQWKLQGGVKEAQLLLPAGSTAITGKEINFTIAPANMELEDWLSLIEVERFDPMGQLLNSALAVARQGTADFAISDVLACLRQRAGHPDLSRFQSATCDALEWRMMALDDLKLFAPGVDVTELLLKPNTASVILLRELGEAVKAVVVAVVYEAGRTSNVPVSSTTKSLKAFGGQRTGATAAIPSMGYD